MGTWRAAAGYVSGMVIVVCIIPVTNMLGGNQSAWVKFGVGFALVIILALLICYKKAKETAVSDEAVKTGSEEECDEEPTPFKEAISKLFANKYWVLIVIMNFAANISYGIGGASGAYYCKWIYGNDNLTGILGSVGLIPTLLGFGLVGPMIKKLGVTKTLKVSFGIGAVATMLRIINPRHFIFNTVLGSFATFANIPMMCLLGVMTAMAIDYNEYKYGKRMVATSQSAVGFGNKVGSGIGASLIGWCLGIAGYEGFAAAASPGVVQAIFTFSIYIPLLLFIAMFMLTFRFDLEAKLPGYKEEIEARKSKGMKV